MEELLFVCACCGAEYKFDDMNDYDEYAVCDVCFGECEQVDFGDS